MFLHVCMWFNDISLPLLCAHKLHGFSYFGPYIRCDVLFCLWCRWVCVMPLLMAFFFFHFVIVVNADDRNYCCNIDAVNCDCCSTYAVMRNNFLQPFFLPNRSSRSCPKMISFLPSKWYINSVFNISQLNSWPLWARFCLFSWHCGTIAVKSRMFVVFCRWYWLV